MPSESISASDVHTYERVSSVIGKRMDSAFKDIMRDLANGRTPLTDHAGHAVAAGDLQIFFKVLKGGSMGTEFQCLVDKPSKGNVFVAENIAPTALTGPAAFISGEINFGGTIRF